MAVIGRTNAEIARLARTLGHSVELERAPVGRARAWCSCGYKSVWRRNDRIAIEAAAHHLWLVTRQHRASGL